MFVKKAAPTLSHEATRGYERELQLLYARRSAIDSLIASLQNYDRYRASRPAEFKRKLA
jgi:hypothetical protein